MVVSWSVVKPALAAVSGLIVKSTAGPLVVLSMPLSMSTTGLLAVHVDTSQGIRHALCPGLQRIGILRKQPDVDRLRSARQVADHVLQQLREVGVDSRLGRLSLWRERRR